jgi:hypothetical protein
MHDPARASVALRLVVALGSLGLLLAGCEASPSSPVPSPSLVYLSFSPLPVDTAPATTPGQPTNTLGGSWPPGWDVAFCAMFDNAVAAQQLIVDVERALSDKVTKDARGLASDLNDSAGQATEQIAALPVWEPAAQAVSEIGDLMDLGTQAAAKYTRYFKDGTKAALRQARQIRSENAAAVPQANSDLARLAGSGLVCPKHALQLESP